MKKETKRKIGIISGTAILYLIYLFSPIEKMDFIPPMLLILMFLSLGMANINQSGGRFV